jgi:hypothetical protein
MNRLPLKLAGAVAAITVLVIGCGGDNTEPGSGTVKDYFTAVQAVVQADAAPAANRGVLDKARISFNHSAPALNRSVPPVTATFHTGSPPTGTGPTVNGTAESTPLVGQPLRFGIVGSGQFTSIFVSVAGSDGYWQIDLPAATTVAELVLTLGANLPSNDFAMHTAVGSGGSAGPQFTAQLSATDLADADIAVTLKWTGASDVDLHVTDPNQQEIYWNHLSTTEGGRLNLDSNAGCQIDNVNQETISWPKGKALTGNYHVVVAYFADCGQASAPYTVTVNAKGHAAQTFSGTFTGASDNTQSNSVATFAFP